MPLSAENRIAIDPSWVVTAVEPLDAVKQSYKEKMDGLE
jgi:sensor domain CHASE-containing protein